MIRRMKRGAFLAGMVWYGITCLAAADPRDMVRGADAAEPSDSVIDDAGVVFGVPFGATEEQVMETFGKPAGLDRSAGR